MTDKQKITGYRQLSQSEINTINRIKALGNEVRALIDSLNGTVPGVDGECPFYPDRRWLSIAQTDLQKGFMALTRAVAQPESF